MRARVPQFRLAFSSNECREVRTLITMKRPEEVNLLAALRAISDREREMRDRLIQARDELNDRDGRFAALEAELWKRFEEHERGTRSEVAHHEREAARLREEVLRLRVRLDGIHASAPMRLYARFKHFPVLRRIAERRTREYEATLQSRLHG